MALKQPQFTEIDLSQTTKSGGAGLEVGPTYLVLYNGQFHVGDFYNEWYGLNFDGIYDAGAQYDPPGQNRSSWQRIWRFDNHQYLIDEVTPLIEGEHDAPQ